MRRPGASSVYSLRIPAEDAPPLPQHRPHNLSPQHHRLPPGAPSTPDKRHLDDDEMMMMTHSAYPSESVVWAFPHPDEAVLPVDAGRVGRLPHAPHVRASPRAV
jgi:hypothetical protein